MFIKKIQNLSIKYKLTISYLILIAILLCSFLLVNTFITARQAKKQILYSIQQIFNQTKSYLDFKTESIRNSLDIIALNDTIKEILEKRSEDYLENIGLWAIDSAKVMRIFYTIKFQVPDMANLHLYMREGLAGVFQNDDFIKLSEIEKTKWYQQLIKNKEVIAWFPPKYFKDNDHDKNYIYVVRNITSSQDIAQSIGAIRVDIPENIFKAILDHAIYTKSTSALILNNDNEIVVSSSNNHYNQAELVKIMQNFSNNETWKIIKHADQELLVWAQPIAKSNWKLILLIPHKEISALSAKSRQQITLISLIVALLTFPLALAVSNSVTKRLQKLMNQMEKVEKGDFDNAKILPENNDEIGKLALSFNYMVDKIAVLMEERYRLGKEIKNLELKALQAQINPHFLYNTLDLINWMSVRANVPEISRIIESLSRFYRLSLSKGEDLVTIKNELEHVKAYVEIQNMRFGDNIKLQINVPEEIHNYVMPKLILQPIVENSIIHGILEKEQEKGTIKIYGKLQEKEINLFIEDNGVGMSEEKIIQILTTSSSNEPHGYGVKNINERLKLYYGADYGLTYKSRPGMGTIAIIRIPAIKKEATGVEK